jgi:hypothetical protein
MQNREEFRQKWSLYKSQNYVLGERKNYFQNGGGGYKYRFRTKIETPGGLVTRLLVNKTMVPSTIGMGINSSLQYFRRGDCPHHLGKNPDRFVNV